MKINFQEDYIIENEVVRLSPLKESHFKELEKYAIHEPELWKYNAGGANGSENMKKYIANAIQQRENENEYPFIVFDKRINKYVGCTRFYAFRPLNNIVDIGYTWYGKESHGNGLNKNCKYLLLDFAFEKIGVERVGFAASNLNERSIHAMKSIGCKEEGVFRNYCLDNYGNRIDAIFLSILRTEWYDTVKENLANMINTK